MYCSLRFTALSINLFKSFFWKDWRWNVFCAHFTSLPFVPDLSLFNSSQYFKIATFSPNFRFLALDLTDGSVMFGSVAPMPSSTSDVAGSSSMASDETSSTFGSVTIPTSTTSDATSTSIVTTSSIDALAFVLRILTGCVVMRTSCCVGAVLLNSGLLEASSRELFEYGTDCIE